MDENGWKSLEMAGNSWEWLEWLEMTGIAGNGWNWNGWEWLRIAGNGWKQQEMTKNSWKMLEWLDKDDRLK